MPSIEQTFGKYAIPSTTHSN